VLAALLFGLDNVGVCVLLHVTKTGYLSTGFNTGIESITTIRELCTRIVVRYIRCQLLHLACY